MSRTKRRLTGDQTWKRFCEKFHRESGNGSITGRHRRYKEKEENESLKMHSKTEIKNFEKNVEYEPLIQAKKFLRSWWR